MSVKASIVADPTAALKQARELLASDPTAAASQARELLKSAPDDPALLRLLGAALRKLGDQAQAEHFEQQAVSASIRSPAHREAARAVAAGDKRRAVTILEGLIARDQGDVVALVMLGLQLSLDHEFQAAEALLRRAVENAPADAAARLALAEHWHRAKRPADALAALDGLAPAAVSTQSQSLRANILRDLGRQDEEVVILRDLADKDPGQQNYHIRLGHAYRTLGRTEDAVAAYRAVIAKAPYEGTSWFSLANLKTKPFTDADIEQMQHGLGLADMPVTNRIRLSFALGKAFDDRGEAERAFKYYQDGNRLRLTMATYKPDLISAWVNQAAAVYTPEFFAARSTAGFPARDPIFVVGMQRSGSTLVEQILDSHPDIEGTAELNEFPTIIREQGDIAHRRGISFNEHLSQMTADEMAAIGEDYIQRTRTYRLTDKPNFTDKMPTNWLYVGLIRLFLPNARIIDVRRHPLDCCFANWKQLYGRGLEHTYSMENMGRYYADYVRLLRLMDEVQPGKIHRVIYERLVDDVEGEVRGLLDYAGLPFHEACLEFHSNERSVRTISAEQVRQPINRRGIGRWRPYEQWLDPMKQALGSALEDWDQ